MKIATPVVTIALAAFRLSSSGRPTGLAGPDCEPAPAACPPCVASDDNL